jgi:hypothetical protein
MSAPPSGKPGKAEKATPWKPLPYPGPRPGRFSAYPDPKFLPPKDLVKLLRLQGIDDTEAAAFVSECSRIAQFMKFVRERSPRARVRDELEHVAKKVREALLAMNLLSENGWERLDEGTAFAMGRDLGGGAEWPDGVRAATTGLNESPLHFTWDVITALEATALLVAGDIYVRRRHRSGEEAAKELASMIASAFSARFGEWPPHHQHSWFVHFMQCIGEHIDVACGPRPVASGVKDAEARDAVARK